MAEHVLLGIKNVEESVFVLIGLEHLFQTLVSLDDIFAIVDHKEEALFFSEV